MRKLSRRWRIAAIISGLLVVFYGGFEFGRSSAGYAVVRSTFARMELANRNRQLAEENESLRHRAATAEVGQRVEKQAQTDARKMMQDLQAETARQQQELQFYRGLVVRQFGSGALRVQEVKIRAVEEGRQLVVITLVQAATRDTVANGTVTLAVDGAQDGAKKRLVLAEIEPGRRKNLPFSLRFFQQIEVEVELPVEFEPESLQVEYRLARAAEPSRQTFPWRVEGESEPAAL